ncbi:hypothetical protein AB9K29_03020 [Phaeobacter italicus]|uniref:hypothetical protein n=1 Tax=Phaeobacter italicus TaxID=481446 RepID=UPI0035119FBE
MQMNGSNDMLVEMEKRLRATQAEIFERYVPDRIARRIVERLLSSATIRPMMELELNGCTSSESARILMAEELISISTFRSRAKGFFGQECEGIELSSLGISTLFEVQEGLEGNPWMSFIQGAIIAYACIDYGSGICGTRSRIESSLDHPDPDVFERFVFLRTGQYQFQCNRFSKTRVDSEERASTAGWWSVVDDVKRGGDILDFSIS